MNPPAAPNARAGGRLPRRYLAFAHFCLLAACCALIVAPRSVAGFYYHPKMVAVVHLVTLGWISASILGSLYLISPMTLGVDLRRLRLDAWAFWFYVIGTLGMTTHFWIDEPRGMVWSAAMVVLGFIWVTARVARGLGPSRLPAEIKVHFYLAFANLGLAAALGIAVGLDKFLPVLPGRSLSNVVAHAHLAALGWVLMLVMGAAYRLLPMLLPAQPPRGLWLWLGAATLEVGVLGLGWSLLTQSPMLRFFGGLVLTALGIFVSRLGWMLRHRRPPARHLRRPDYGVLQVMAALASLLVTALLAALLLFAPDGSWKLPVALAYGTMGLLGFFGQMIAGVAARLLPIQAYLDAPLGEGCSRTSPPPAALPARGLERMVFWFWVPAVPALALALAFDWTAAIRLASASVAAGVLSSLASHAYTERRARSGSAPGPDQPKAR